LVAPLLTDYLRARRRGKAGRRWHADETYVKIQGVWCSLYRAIDADGNLVDSLLSEHRDMDAAKRSFRQAVKVVGHIPEKVTTDGHDAYPRAIRETLGEDVVHRCSRYLNNKIEQDHRGIKGRCHPMRGFGDFDSAVRFCSPTMNCATTFGIGPRWMRWSRWASNGTSIAPGRRSCGLC
jgi:transposase-like protein